MIFNRKLGGMNTINYFDFKLLSSTNSMNAYPKSPENQQKRIGALSVSVVNRLMICV